MSDINNSWKENQDLASNQMQQGMADLSDLESASVRGGEGQQVINKVNFLVSSDEWLPVRYPPKK